MIKIEFINLRGNNFIQNDGFSLCIDKAKCYNLTINKDQKDICFTACSGLTFDYTGHILVNNLNIKECQYAKYYLQRHTLFITQKGAYLQNLTVRQNIKLISYLWGMADLSETTICGFNFEEIADVKVKLLSDEEKVMLSISRILSCPSYFWIIDKKALYLSNGELSAKNKSILNNIFDIRTKQNGAILMLEEFI